jgi:hypothetical protein
MSDGGSHAGVRILLLIAIILTIAPAFLLLGSQFSSQSRLVAIPLIACSTIAVVGLVRPTKTNVTLVSTLLGACAVATLILGLELTWPPPSFGRAGVVDLYAVFEARAVGVIYGLFSIGLLLFGKKHFSTHA